MAVRKYTITLGQLTNNGVPCPNPVVTLVNSTGFAFNCIDEERGIYEVEVIGELTETSLQFLVQCEECGDCPPEVVIISICDTIDDCGPCEVCINGACVSQCAPGEICVNDQCVECVTSDDCPCNQVCINGDCSCPPGTTPNGDCCDECSTDSDCGVCEICVNGDCIPNDCGDQVCNPVNGDCVDCISTGDCGVNECCINNVCACCPGFVLVNGVCVPAPECTTDADCDECEVCRNGVCVPIQCPPGQVCIPGFGCVDECDCNDPTSCDDPTSFCYQGTNGICGCVPCQGNCTTGCQFPCYCDPVTDRCVVNNCAGPCTNGLDCGEGCGCLNGQCVPCSTLDCTSNECSQALGCDCIGTVCSDADDLCNNAPCSTADDCGFGCTCYEGECVSCENFSCLNLDCENQPGCDCVGGNCEGADDDCTDSLDIIENTQDCSITGKLVKSNCCACPKLTADVRGRRVSSTTEQVTMDFIAELRKGAYDGVSVISNPLLDDFSNDVIAENEPPIGGTIRMVYVVKRDVYNIAENGTRTFVGQADDPQVQLNRSFSAAGNIATLSFSGVTFPQIGSEIIDGDQAKVVRSISIVFRIANTLVFPNECNYASEEIGQYAVDNFSVFTTTYGNGRATTISSPDCRLPFFKWTKSTDGVFDEAPFRKIYVDGNGTYEDLLDTFELGVQSCRYFLLDVDCTCEDPVSKYIMFCKPEDLDMSVTNCGRTITIDSFNYCDANREVTYYVNAGSINLSFLAPNAPIGTPYTSTVDIELVEFGAECDVAGKCTKTYTVPKTELVPDYSVDCDPLTGTFDITFFAPTAVPGCNLDRVVIGGQTVFAGGNITLVSGVYEAVAYWSCGCEPTPFVVTEYCCEVGIPTISRDCQEGTVCSQGVGVTYTFNGVETTDVCALVEGLDPSMSAVITATKPNCGTSTFNLPSLADTCCSSFNAYITEVSETELLLTVLSYSGTLAITVDDPAVIVTDLGAGQYRLTNVSTDTPYGVTVTDSICGEVDLTYTIEGCGLDVVLNVLQPCTLRAVPNQASCHCFSGGYNMEINDVTDLGSQLEIEFTTYLSSFDADYTSGTLTVAGEEFMVEETAATVIVDKPLVYTGKCYNNLFALVSTSGPIGAKKLQLILQANGQGLLGGSYWTNAQVTIDGQLANVISGNIFESSQVITPGSTVDIRIQAEEVSTGALYVYTYATFPTSGTLNGLSFCEVELDNTPVNVTFALTDLVLEDGCEYDRVAHTFIVYPNGNIQNGGPGVGVLLTPLDINQRKVKFRWFKDNSFLWEDWQYGPSTLPDDPGYYEQGSTYRVEANCNPCDDTVETVLCCPITVEIEIQPNLP